LAPLAGCLVSVQTSHVFGHFAIGADSFVLFAQKDLTKVC